MSKQRLILVALAAAGLGGLIWAWNRNRENANDSDRKTANGPDEVRSSISSSSMPGYVGSRACAECHEEIASDYRTTHSMARSASLVGEEVSVENYARAEFETPDQRRYTVEQDESGIRHRELLLGRSGKTLSDLSERVSLIIGSGRRGRSYVVERDGLLFQSPICWYTQKDAFDLAPGYEPATHARFDRRITKECVFCHLGRVEFADFYANRLTEAPPPELAIGCERCHGSGEAHVKSQQAGAATVTNNGDPTIVNPARLAPAQRDAVCYQCHLRSDPLFTRSGRTAFDYRPGENYEDTWLAFVPRPDQSETPATIVEQIRSSACYLQSKERLGCISCHDPHRRVTVAEQPGFYRERCMKCHSGSGGEASRSSEVLGCSLPEEQRLAAPAGDSCIACHMPPLPAKDIPHTAFTDHRLRRDPSAQPIKPDAGNAKVTSYVLFDGAEKRLPDVDVRRARGMLLIMAAAAGEQQLVAEAEKLFNPSDRDPEALFLEFRDDHAMLSSLGIMFAMSGRPQMAVVALQRALELEPTNESDLASLMRIQASAGIWDGALDTTRRFLEVNPYLAEYHWIQSRLYQEQGELSEAIAAAEKSLERNPTAIDVRVWLARAYAQAGQPEKAAAQAALIRDLRGP